MVIKMKQKPISKPFFSAEQMAAALEAAPEQAIEDEEFPVTDWNNAIVSYSLDELHNQLEERRKSQVDKEQVAISFSQDVLAAFRATGKGWQNRMDEALKDWLKTHSLST